MQLAAFGELDIPELLIDPKNPQVIFTLYVVNLNIFYNNLYLMYLIFFTEKRETIPRIYQIRTSFVRLHRNARFCTNNHCNSWRHFTYWDTKL